MTTNTVTSSTAVTPPTATTTAAVARATAQVTSAATGTTSTLKDIANHVRGARDTDQESGRTTLPMRRDLIPDKAREILRITTAAMTGDALSVEDYQRALQQITERARMIVKLYGETETDSGGSEGETAGPVTTPRQTPPGDAVTTPSVTAPTPAIERVLLPERQPAPSVSSQRPRASQFYDESRVGKGCHVFTVLGSSVVRC